MTETDFLAALRTLPLHRGARRLLDDAAIISGLVVTCDTLVEGVHFLPDDPAADIAWKLVATNLSDLAAKGARPEGVVLSYPLSDAEWDRAFVMGLSEVLEAHGCTLIGGDTTTLPAGAPRVLTVTALGSDAAAPARNGAEAGDALWVTGAIGDAGAGLAIAKGADGPAELLARYRRPRPRLSEGRALGPVVHAMMDVSDGLLIDAKRMAEASGLQVSVDLEAVPLSSAYRAWGGDALTAATAGDDYELLFALPDGAKPPVAATCVGAFSPGEGLELHQNGAPVPLPARLGWLHATA